MQGVSTARNSIDEASVEAKRDAIEAKNCPWRHRVVLLARVVMRLEDAITVDVLFPNRPTKEEQLRPNLWKFAPNPPTFSDENLVVRFSEAVDGFPLP